MPSIKKIIGVVVAGMSMMTSALPAQLKLTQTQLDLYSLTKRRQAAAANLIDVNILQL